MRLHDLSTEDNMNFWNLLCTFFAPSHADCEVGSTSNDHALVNPATGLHCDLSSGIDSLGSPLGVNLHDTSWASDWTSWSSESTAWTNDL